MNLFSYVQNNPINYTDPFGLNPLAAAIEGASFGGSFGGPWGAAGGAVIGGLAGAAIGQWAWDNWFANEGNEGDEGQCTTQEPSSPGKMQQDVKKGRAPEGVDRVDRGHLPGQEPHVHYDDGTSSTQSGGVHDKHKGTPQSTNKIKKWLKKHGWNIP